MTIQKTSYIKHYALLLVLAWSIIVFALLLWATIRTNEETLEYAHIYTNAAFDKDILYRRWATMHGGVYVPVTNNTPPNPYLSDIPERDFITPSGRMLTLMNPAYMTRQAYEIEKNSSESRSHITSLKPIKPENAPDEWEKKALVAFERGETEIYSVEILEGREYFRLMKPFITEQGCLRCHATQGYKVNEIRGGISVSMPMDSISKLAGTSQDRTKTIYIILWLVGIGGLVLGYFQVSKIESKRNQSEEALQKSEEKFRTVADFTYEWEYWLDPQQQPIYISPSVERISGYRPEEFIKNTGLLYSIIHPDDKVLFQQHMEIHHYGGVPGDVDDIEFRIIARNGEVRWINHVCRAIYNEEKQYLGRRASNRDITERKLTEEEIKKHREHLEEMVNERTREVKLAKEEAERANMAKTNFLQTMSHELRTPLNAVLGFSELLKEKTSGELNEKQERFIDNIITGGNNLHNIISQILDVVKMDEGTLELHIEKIPVPEIVDEVIGVIKECAAKKKLLLEKNLDPELEYIEADKLKFKQVFINLLENAVKFSKQEGGNIKITVKKEGDMAKFSVSDTGIGIREDDVGKLFQKFTQLDTGTTRKYGGTGIGLAATKQLVELHGGKIWAQSKYGEGSTFIFTLPVKSFANRGSNLVGIS